MSSLVLAHGAPELKLVHFETQANNLLGRFGQAANQALYAVQELEIQAELTIEQIAEHFGIHHFGIHIMAKSLSNCKIILTSDSHLEIHRENQQQPTRFRVKYREQRAANDERYELTA
jgi:hypothetical protein